MSSHIYVCQSGTCRSKGSDATLIEIEELSKLVDASCTVNRSGCMGYCSQGPAVMTVKKQRPQYHIKINTIQKATEVIRFATGEKPAIENLPIDIERRLNDVGAKKKRDFFLSTYQWNKALSGFNRSANASEQKEIRGILKCAGYPNLNIENLLNPLPPLQMPSSIDGYVMWKLKSFNVVSKHSAIFHFETKDQKRGSPHPRGRARNAEPITWRVTMLGEVGTNEEGPLPWVERDYTPISSALEWEQGRCSLLIKIYTDGMLSSWLHKNATQFQERGVWLSKPMRTLSVPSLIADEDDGFRPKNVLLLIAGTGIVALSQIMARRDPHRLLGFSTPKRKQMKCHIDLIHSCNECDLLMLPEIKKFCIEGTTHPSMFRGLRSYTLLISPKKVNATRDQDHNDGSCSLPPFEGTFSDDNTKEHLAELQSCSNVTVMTSRLRLNIIEQAVKNMETPYRIVVSGPDSYNSAVKKFLDECFVDPGSVTLLSA